MPPDDTRPLPASPGAFPAEREFVVTRDFPHPPAEVFRAWTVPERLARWWGPEGFAIPVARADLRPGGAWRLVMRSPEGIDYPLRGIYQEIIDGERLVMTVDLHEHPGEWQDLFRLYRHDNEGTPAPEMVWVATFAARDGGTRLVFRVGFGSRTERHAMLRMGMAEGWAQSLERLARYLATAEENEV